uniref:HMG box domain-containing protein n=1 Tax=Romanomermis culicivorax TaxID=13658 RepID=A0A915JUX4_ROMCU
MALPDDGERWPSAPDRTLEETYMRHSRFKRRKVPPSKPKRPVTGYDIFFRNTYPQIKKNNPSMTQPQIYSYIGRMWRENTTWLDRQICYDFADDEKDRYYAEVIEWRKKREKMLEFDREASKTVIKRRERRIAEIQPQNVAEEVRGQGQALPQKCRYDERINSRDVDDCKIQ